MLHSQVGSDVSRRCCKTRKEVSIINCKQQNKTDFDTQARSNTENDVLEANGEIRLFGVRAVIANPVSACEKIDKMFGTGGEAIIHYMWFECGHSLFDYMIKSNVDKGKDELLRALVNVQPGTGWGNLTVRVVQADPPLVHLKVRNPPVKTIKGSQKQIIGSFWAGVLSRHFSRQLVCKNFLYDSDQDEFSCTITV